MTTNVDKIIDLVATDQIIYTSEILINQITSDNILEAQTITNAFANIRNNVKSVSSSIARSYSTHTINETSQKSSNSNNNKRNTSTISSNSVNDDKKKRYNIQYNDNLE